LSRPDLSDFPPGFEFPIEDALEEIERALDTLGWSRAELSRRATEKKGEKVSAQTVSNVLNRTYPRSKDLPFMLEALGLPFELAIPGLTTTQRRAAIKLRELGPEAAEAYLTVLLGLKGR
jgi:lambda repressor-like predicted transcriptional regulator